MEWINAFETKPEKRQTVIINISRHFGGGIKIAVYVPNYSNEFGEFGETYIAEDKSFWKGSYISNWMPLPEPPKE